MFSTFRIRCMVVYLLIIVEFIRGLESICHLDFIRLTEIKRFLHI